MKERMVPLYCGVESTRFCKGVKVLKRLQRNLIVLGVYLTTAITASYRVWGNFTQRELIHTLVLEVAIVGSFAFALWSRTDILAVFRQKVLKRGYATQNEVLLFLLGITILAGTIGWIPFLQEILSAKVLSRTAFVLCVWVLLLVNERRSCGGYRQLLLRAVLLVAFVLVWRWMFDTYSLSLILVFFLCLSDWYCCDESKYSEIVVNLVSVLIADITAFVHFAVTDPEGMFFVYMQVVPSNIKDSYLMRALMDQPVVLGMLIVLHLSIGGIVVIHQICIKPPHGTVLFTLCTFDMSMLLINLAVISNTIPYSYVPEGLTNLGSALMAAFMCNAILHSQEWEEDSLTAEEIPAARMGGYTKNEQEE